MRVIAGSARGRRLATLAGAAVRPTADRVKEALFSMLESRFALEGAVLLDLFAGSGGLGIEALSRGAATVVFVDTNPAALRLVRDNLAACRFTARLRSEPAQKALVRLATEGARFDGVFLDPPYASDELRSCLEFLSTSTLLAADAWVVAEHPHNAPPPDSFPNLQLTVRRRYGKTALSLYGAVALAMDTEAESDGAKT